MSSQNEPLDPIDDPEVEPIPPSPKVRTLQEPPDIWDMVHETHTDFKPGSAFVGRLTSHSLWLAVVLLIIAGGAVFWFMRSRGQAGSKPAAPMVQAESKQVNTGLSSRSVPANPAASLPAQEQVKTPASITSISNSGTTTIAGSQPAPENSTPSSQNSQPANTPARPDTGQSASKTNGAVMATSSRTQSEVKPRRQNLPGAGMFTDAAQDKQAGTKVSNSSTARGEVVALTGNKDGTQTSNTSGPKTDNPKPGGPSATKKDSDKPASPQLIAPARANPTPKPKVIPWP